MFSVFTILWGLAKCDRVFQWEGLLLPAGLHGQSICLSQGSGDSFGFVPFCAHVRFGVFDSTALVARFVSQPVPCHAPVRFDSFGWARLQPSRGRRLQTFGGGVSCFVLCLCHTIHS